MKKTGLNQRATRRLVRSSTVEPATHIIIGNRLRQYYQDIVQQPVPERFTSLLKELEGKLASGKSR